MKNIEEKAKAYDSIIEKANKMHSENCEACQACIEELIPELAESEDERIVKELLTFFRESIHGGHILTNKEYDSWIAWLEKQGEQKPNPYSGISFEYNGHTWGMCVRDNGVDILYDKHLIKHLEKQGEKKPIDETPYPETLEKAIDLYYYSYGNGKGEFEHLSLEKFRDIVYTFVSDYGQKPIEWSEEDEQHIDSILKRLDALCRNKIERTRFAISEDRDWLKSLRPQNRWKPSDEQMEALDWQVENTSVSSWQYKATKELMEDLKKLKEE